jgi:hypothetical protein
MGKRIFRGSQRNWTAWNRSYFDFARAGWSVADRAVKEFKAEDLEAAGARMIAALGKSRPKKSRSLRCCWAIPKSPRTVSLAVTQGNQ